MSVKGNQWTITKRPQKLDDVYGYDVIKTYFRNIKMKNKPIPTGIWLQGLFGSGKTTVAKIIAKMIQCEHPDENGNPCNCCDSCVSIEEENFNRDTIMFNGGTDGTIDKIRTLLTNLDMPSLVDKNKVIIIEEAQEISMDGINALLKALEYPSEDTYFIFTSMAEKNSAKMRAIQSRCRKFDFKPAGVMDVMYYLKSILESENLWLNESIPEPFFTYGLQAIATNCSGSYRQALQMLEQCIDSELYTPEDIQKNLGLIDMASIYTVLEHLLNGDANTLVLDTLLEGDYLEQFNLAYTALSNAALLRTFGKLPDNLEFFKSKIAPLANHEKLDVVLQGFDKIAEQGAAYLKKSTYYIGICDIINKCKGYTNKVDVTTISDTPKFDLTPSSTASQPIINSDSVVAPEVAPTENEPISNDSVQISRSIKRVTNEVVDTPAEAQPVGRVVRRVDTATTESTANAPRVIKRY